MAKELYLYSPFYSETAETAVRELNDISDDEDLTIRINTPGGSVTDGWAIISKLSEREGEKKGVIDGVAMSMGGMLLLFLDHVTANDTSEIMLHKAAYPSWHEASEVEMAKLKAINEKFKEKLEAKIGDKKGGQEVIDKVFEPDVRNNVDISPKEAKRLGIVHEVRQLEPTAYHGKQIVAINEVRIKNKSNINIKKMGKLSDLIFGEKDPILLAVIGGNQYAYSKIEEGTKLKAIGKGENKPASGTFETENKVVTVVDSEITAIKTVDDKQRKIDELTSRISAIEEKQLTAEDVAEVFEKFQANNSSELQAIKETLASAKLQVSKPVIPEGNFDDNAPVVEKTEKQKQREIQELINAEQARIAEAYRNSQLSREVQ